MGDTMHSFCPVLHKSPRVRFESGGPYEAPAGKDMPLHCHETWEIIYYRKGAIDSIVGDEVIPGQPGVVVPIPPYVGHAERSATGYANYFVHFRAPLNHPWPRVCYDDEYGMIGHVCAALVREWMGESHCRSEMMDLLAGQLDVLLQRCYEQTSLSHEELIVRRAERLIQERMQRGVRIGLVAEEIGVSPSHLRDLFVRLRGESPMDYLQALRVRSALGMLRNGDAGLETIADACGYDSASHLSRHIKRATGMSPGAQRNVVEHEPLDASGDFYMPWSLSPNEMRQRELGQVR